MWIPSRPVSAARPSEGSGDGGGEVDGLVSVQPAFAAGEGEQGLDQARLLIAGGEHLLGGGTPGGGRRAGVIERNLEEGALGRQGGAQLVGGVGDEVPLGLEGGFEGNRCFSPGWVRMSW